ncbi:MAG: hypothetical protein U0M13_10640, partial [Desulfovibrio fairfieldensis]|nr:hypothetical protein [Desulfovibrio fairfieldensis]
QRSHTGIDSSDNRVFRNAPFETQSVSKVICSTDGMWTEQSHAPSLFSHTELLPNLPARPDKKFFQLFVKKFLILHRLQPTISL